MPCTDVLHSFSSIANLVSTRYPKAVIFPVRSSVIPQASSSSVSMGPKEKVWDTCMLPMNLDLKGCTSFSPMCHCLDQAKCPQHTAQEARKCNLALCTEEV